MLICIYNSKEGQKNSDILCSEIPSPEIENPNPTSRLGNSRRTHSLNFLVSIVSDKVSRTKRMDSTKSPV